MFVCRFLAFLLSPIFACTPVVSSSECARVAEKRTHARAIAVGVTIIIRTTAIEYTAPADIIVPYPLPPIHKKKQTARVVATNDGAIPTRFTVTDASLPPENQFSANGSISDNDAPTTAASLPNSGTAISPDNTKQGVRCSGGGDGSTFPWPNSKNPTEAEILAKAAAAGDAGTVRPEGRGTLEVEGGGHVAGYGSSEIVVTFSPLSVRNFKTTKVCSVGGKRGGCGLWRGVAV